MPSCASVWGRYARPAAAPGRTGLCWARGGPSFPPPVSGRAPVLPRERLAVLILWVALLSPLAQRFRWFQELCVCVCVCVHVSVNVCDPDPLLTTGRANVHIRENRFSNSPAFSFSVFSLESAWVDGLAHTYWFLCVPARVLGLQGPVWQPLATRGYLMKHLR